MTKVEKKETSKKKETPKKKEAPQQKKVASASAATKLGPSLFERYYRDVCVPQLMKEFGYRNVMQIPRVEKVVLNTCLKDAVSDFKVLEQAAEELGLIAGQRPVYTKAKKSISNFKLREGIKIGACVTLRKQRMYEFLNRLFHIALPRVRDFKGLSPKSTDGRGGYTFGLTEQVMFPEINLDKVNKVYGMNVTICTTAKTPAETLGLLKALGMPVRS
ncbi:MAG: 50S ribosomal protein L5 [Deltaproteobacteria bacterium]|nr:50S ribosomal protein L5 [Deltaproteobacteria bacterium]